MINTLSHAAHHPIAVATVGDIAIQGAGTLPVQDNLQLILQIVLAAASLVKILYGVPQERKRRKEEKEQAKKEKK